MENLELETLKIKYDALAAKLAISVEALESVKQLGKGSKPCPDGISGCAVYHYEYNAQSRIAIEALSKFGGDSSD